jgi:hypothetical protein
MNKWYDVTFILIVQGTKNIKASSVAKSGYLNIIGHYFSCVGVTQLA